VLSLNKIANQVGDPTFLVVNRISGDLTGLAPAIGPIFGTLIDDAQTVSSFNFFGGCQVKDLLQALVPPIIPNIPIGRTGWMKFSATSDFGLFGAAIRFNSGMGLPAFKGGHNLHKLTLTDSVSLTVPLFITNPPFTIICPPDVIAVTAKPGERNVTVTYPTPAAMGSSTGTTVVCSPPSGSSFSVGATPVTCTATFPGGVTATCSFKVTVFDVCLEDDRSGDTLLFNSFTGDYQFTSCNGDPALTGRGRITRVGCSTKLVDGTRVSATLDHCPGSSLSKGSAIIRRTPIGPTSNITDSNTNNNACACR